MLVSVFKKVPGVRNVLQLEQMLGVVSLVWEEMFDTIGKVQAVFVKNSLTRSTIKVGKFLAIAASNNIAYIHSVKITDTEVWAYGYEAKGLYQKKPSVNIGDNYGEVSVSAAVKSRLETYGEISFVDLSSSIFPDIGTANLDSLDYTSVYDYVNKALKSKNAGWSARFAEHPTGLVYLQVGQGQDKSGEVFFSPLYGTARNLVYTEDSQTEVNRVYVVGLDDGNVVFDYVDGPSTDGETWAKYLDLRLEYPKPEGMSSADYLDALHNRASISLGMLHRKYKLTVGDVDPSGYGTDYQLGDTVAVAMPDGLTEAKARVGGIRRTSEKGIDTLAVILDDIDLS